MSAVIAIITVVGVGTYNFDFSDSSTNIDSSENTNIEGGENIFNKITNIAPKEIAKEAGLIFICTQDEIPESHKEACEDYNR